jgi:hypothetical protein
MANISGFDSAAAGPQTVTVTVGGKTASFNVTVNPATLVSIAVTAPPTKTAYNQGESLDLTGLVVTGTNSDGGTAPLAVTMANISGFDSAAAGPQTVTVTVGGKTASFNVTVNPAPTYTVTVNSLTNGAVSASPTSAAAGTTITLTVTPASGYVLQAGSLKVNNGAVSVAGSGSTYTFTMPAANVTVGAVFTRQFGITIEGPAEQMPAVNGVNSNASRTPPTDISYSAGEFLTFTVDDSAYTHDDNNLKWYVDGNDVTPATGSSLEVRATSYIKRTYTLTAMIKKDGLWYSGETQFTVIE